MLQLKAAVFLHMFYIRHGAKKAQIKMKTSIINTVLVHFLHYNHSGRI